MRCLTWNLAWASPSSKRGGLIQKIIRQLDPAVVCYTEALLGMIPDGYRIHSDADYGYRHTGEKRKVILWSKTPWEQIDTLGEPAMPPGRFASGVTQGIRFVGVCIPWRDAHVGTGRKDRKPWEDHLTYCAGLKRILARYHSERAPICVLGDYNQRLPRGIQPEHVANALLGALPEEYRVATAGVTDMEGKQLIDHITVSPSLGIDDIQIIPRTVDGTKLSDHVGIGAIIECAKATAEPWRCAR